MNSRAAFQYWLVPMALSCLAVVSACSSSSDSPNPGTAGSTSLAGATTGGSSSAGSSAGGAATAGPAAGGTAGTAGGAGAGGAGAGGGAAAGASGGAGGAAGASGGSGGTAGAAGSSGSAGGGNGGVAGAGGSGFTLTSPAWISQPGCAPASKTGCGVFPKENINTGIGGGNKSPELDWTAGPAGTQSYAIVLHDLTYLVNGKPNVHWVMWNIPSATRMLPPALETTAMPSVPAGSSQRSYSGNGYQGSGACGNVYEFILYALPTATFTPNGTTQTAAADGLAATGAPTATLRARSGAPGCTGG
jgi:phosphatidylethanolamine-binding protein (PEBP) family uncharacterized protein